MKLSKTQQILSNVNIFQYKQNFNVNGSKGYHSIFSFIMSFIFYLIFIGMVYYFSFDWLFQKNPKIDFTRKSYNFNDTKEINLTDIIDSLRIMKRYQSDEKNKTILEILKEEKLDPKKIFTLYIDIRNAKNNKVLNMKKTIPYSYSPFVKSLYIFKKINFNEKFEVKDYLNGKIISNPKIYNASINEIKLNITAGYQFIVTFSSGLSNIKNSSVVQTLSGFHYKAKSYFFDAFKRSGFSEDPFEYFTSDNKKYYLGKKNTVSASVMDKCAHINFNFLEVEDNRGNLFSEITNKKKFEVNLNKMAQEPNTFFGLK